LAFHVAKRYSIGIGGYQAEIKRQPSFGGWAATLPRFAAPFEGVEKIVTFLARQFEIPDYWFQIWHTPGVVGAAAEFETKFLHGRSKRTLRIG